MAISFSKDGDRSDGPLGLSGPAGAPPGASPPVVHGARLRIAGTGEFTCPPFPLAERLERAGHDVAVQATRWSPARWGVRSGAATLRQAG